MMLLMRKSSLRVRREPHTHTQAGDVKEIATQPFDALSLPAPPDRRLIVIHHPDKQAGEKGMVGRTGRAKGSGETDPRFLAIKKAYETLSDESRRRA